MIKTSLSDLSIGKVFRLNENKAKITDIKSNEIKISDDENRMNVLVDLKLNAEKKTNGLYFQNQKLKENSIMFIEGNKTSLQGIITRINLIPFSNEIEEKILTIELKKREQWLVDSISINSKEFQYNKNTCCNNKQES